MPPKSATIQHPVLILTQSGDVTSGKIPCAGPLTVAAIQTFLKKKKGVESVASYKSKSVWLNMYAATEGKEEQQNQHQLPPPNDTGTFYGDIVLIASKEEGIIGTPIAYTAEEYEQFYTKMFGGNESDDEGEEGDDADADVEVDDLEEPAEEGKEFADAEAEEEDDEDDEEEDEVEVEGDGEVQGDDDAVVAPTPVKAKPLRKKKAVARPAAAFAGVGSAYPDAPILSEAEQLQEEIATAVTAPQAEQRLKVLASLKKIFTEYFSEQTILDLERCIYNGAIKQARNRHIVRSWKYPLFAHLYKMQAIHITSNFHPNSYVKNTELFDQFQKGEMTLESIADMNVYELFPSHWRDMFEQQQMREKNQLEGNRAMATDQFLCTRCWKRECTYYEMQTRSADEPMTIFITCVNCGKHWRQ